MAEDVNIRINVDASNSVKETTNFKAKLKELRDQMVELEVSTNGLSEATEEQRNQYAALQAEAGKISDALGDVSQRIKASADDYQNFNAAMEGGKGLIAMAQGVEGVTSLLGVNSQTVERSIQVMGSLQSVMNSVNTVQQLFNKDSKVRIAIEKLLQTETKKTAVADAEATAATGALAAGEGVATGASFTLVGALKAVSVAIKSIPVIGWILAAVAAVGSLIALIVSANDESEEGVALQEAASENLERQQEQYEQVDSKILKIKDDLNTWNDILLTADKNSTIYKDTLKKLGNQLDVDLENQKLDVQTLNKLENIHLKLKEAELKAEFDQNQYLADRNKLQQINNVLSAAAGLDHKERKQFIQDELGISEKAAASYAAAIHNGMDAHTTWQQALQAEGDATAASYKRLQDSVDSYSDKAKANSASVISLTNEQDKIIKESGLKRKSVSEDTGKTVVKTAKNTTKEIDKEAEEEAKKIKQRADEVAKGISDASKKITDYKKESDKAIRQENDKTHEGRLWNIQAEYGETIQNLDNELKAHKEFYNKLSDEEKQNTITVEQFANEQKNLRQQALDNFLQAQQDELTAEERLRIDEKNRIDNAVLQTRLANLQEGSQEYYDLQQKILDKQREQDLENLQRQYDDELISKEEFEAQKAKIEEEYNQKSVENTQAAQQSKFDTYANIIQQIGKVVQMGSNLIMSLQDAELANAEGNEKKQKEIKKKYAVANAVSNIAQIGIDQAMAAVGVWASVADIPFPGNVIAGGILSGVVAATGIAATVKAIREKNNIMKAKRGAFIVGPSHSEGGVNWELEGGEAVLNKNAMAIPQYRAIASAMNVSTGGVAYPGTNQSQSFMTSTIDRSDLKAIVSETVAAVTSIPVVVSESSITNTQRKVSTIEGRSRI